VNGIELIERDHRAVSELFTRFEDAPDAGIVGLVVEALTLHDQAEHAALYPLVDVIVDPEISEAAEHTHTLIKRQIGVVVDLEGDALVAAFAELRTLVEAHVAEEETALLPALAAAATPQMLDGLAARFLQAKQRVG
jgi:hypothetical protein